VTAPIGAVAGATPTVNAWLAQQGPNATQGAGAEFGDLITEGMGKLQQVQSNADDMAVSAATGDLTDVHDYMIAATEAQLATQLTVAIRNKAVDAFNEIMRMQA
jgi:flagellar hook-basal body complex protein FliE